MPEGADLSVTFNHDRLDELFENLDVVATISYTADYAAYVEFPTEYTGTSPPFRPIYEWVQRKWPDLDQGLKDAAKPEDGEVTREELQRRVAWIVVSAIAESGTDGVFFLNRSLEAAKQAGEDFLEEYEGTNDIDAARKAIEDTVDFAFDTSQKIVAEEASDTGNLLQSGRVIVLQSGQETFEREGGN